MQTTRPRRAAPCAGEDLSGDVAAEVAVGVRARDDDAGRDRDQQRRDLRREAVADGQQRVGVAASLNVRWRWSDADDDAADQVDQR
jgi:hypothetical protein